MFGWYTQKSTKEIKYYISYIFIQLGAGGLVILDIVEFVSGTSIFISKCNTKQCKEPRNNFIGIFNKILNILGVQIIT